MCYLENMARGLLLGAGAAVTAAAAAIAIAACAADEERSFGDDPNDGGGSSSSGFLPSEGGVPGLPEEETRDPATCEEAATTKSYVGCDYWPTVTANGVWSIFDFAVVIANTGTANADVTVTGPNAVNEQLTVPAGELRTIYLPWVQSLKGPEANECLIVSELANSVSQPNGAYHLVSSVPVIVYQFNALQYQGQGGEAPDGGPKDWSSCLGTTTICNDVIPPKFAGCLSYSNDASLLLPSTAMTGNYRVVGQRGWTEPSGDINGAFLTITATAPGTQVSVDLAPQARVLASQVGGVPAIAATNGGTLTFPLANAGDVVELVTPKGAQFDFSGSLVRADKPVQVISGNPCINIPSGKLGCDHLEESVLPAETLGKHYLVHPPTGPNGNPVKHVVRFYGNKDGTTLTYDPVKPAGCPDSLVAGMVVDCGMIDVPFDVTGTQDFAVATFLVGASEINPPGDRRGDPSLSTVAAIEQFRTKYLFLSPRDYAVRYVDITSTEDADITLDGMPVTAPWTAVGNSKLGVRRVPLGAGKNGAHLLTSKRPVGIQVIGYGDNTSFHYPGGLNLKLIAPPPKPN